MARKRAEITAQDFPRHAGYLSDRLEENVFDRLLRPNSNVEEAIEKFRKVTTPLEMMDWQNQFLSPSGRKRLISALSNRNYYNTRDSARIVIGNATLKKLDKLVEQDGHVDKSMTERRSDVLDRAIAHLEMAER